MLGIVSFIMIILGSSILLLSIFLYIPLYRSMNKIRDQVNGVTRILFGSYIVLMIFFFFGYIGTGASIVIGVEYSNVFLIAMIFFFGSIFVFVGIVVQTRLVTVLHKTNMQIMATLISAVEARDLNLKGHSNHVVAIALLIYDHLPQNYKRLIDRQKLEYAGLLHDIGKLGIPEKILYKDSALNDAEWAVMRDHARIGKQILSKVDTFEEMRDWVLYHHERMDGKGYYKIEGKNIPLASRIIAVADTYSAIVMRRSYKKAKDHAEAMGILLQNAGTQFDPFIVSVFSHIDQSEITKNLSLLAQDVEINEDIIVKSSQELEKENIQ